MIKRFSKNQSGRDFIVGDVHGYFTKLQEALDEIGFDTSNDRLFMVGDLVDRGPESDLVLEWLNKPWLHAVQGNHEDMAISHAMGASDASMYLANGGAWNLSNPDYLQKQISDAFSEMPIAIELETEDGVIGIVHADVPFKSWSQFVNALSSTETSDMERNHICTMAMWNRQRIEHEDRIGVQGVRAVVVGHTPVKDVVKLGNVYHIDTGGWLQSKYDWARFTILDAATLKEA